MLKTTFKPQQQQQSVPSSKCRTGNKKCRSTQAFDAMKLMMAIYDSAEIRNLLLILLHCELDFHFLVNCENVQRKKNKCCSAPEYSCLRFRSLVSKPFYLSIFSFAFRTLSVENLHTQLAAGYHDQFNLTPDFLFLF